MLMGGTSTSKTSFEGFGEICDECIPVLGPAFARRSTFQLLVSAAEVSVSLGGEFSILRPYVEVENAFGDAAWQHLARK